MAYSTEARARDLAQYGALLAEMHSGAPTSTGTRRGERNAGLLSLATSLVTGSPDLAVAGAALVMGARNRGRTPEPPQVPLPPLRSK